MFLQNMLKELVYFTVNAIKVLIILSIVANYVVLI